jgi:Calx-beta domain/NHL repeat
MSKLKIAFQATSNRFFGKTSVKTGAVSAALVLMLMINSLFGAVAHAAPNDTADKLFGRESGSFADNGVNPGSFDTPFGVSADSNGGVYVSDVFNNRVLYFGNDGNYLADKVFGQNSNFYTKTALTPQSANTLSQPTQVVVDSSGGVYIIDQLCSRVLYYASDGNTTADKVWGQLSLTDFASCGGGVSQTTFFQPEGIAVDSSGGLYVADSNNNRVVYFANDGNNAADRVYGQLGSYTTSDANKGGTGPTANNMQYPTAVAIDSTGGLYVADSLNNRVLYFGNEGNVTADEVWGQATFTTATAGLGSNGLNYPQGLFVDSAGNLYVADGNNNRLLYFANDGNTTADKVYGQGGVFSTGTANKGGLSADSLNSPKHISLDANGGLYVADPGNNRALYYANDGNTTADKVWGQGGNFLSNNTTGGVNAKLTNNPYRVTTDSTGGVYVADSTNNRVLYFANDGNTTADKVWGQGGSFLTNQANKGGVSADSLSNPLGVISDSTGGVYIADSANNRVLYFANDGNTTADKVWGQGGSFLTNQANNGGVSADSLRLPRAVALNSDGGLYVADTENHRVLYFANDGNTTADRVYGQSGSFTANGGNQGYWDFGTLGIFLHYPVDVAVDSNGGLYVADTANNRVLYFSDHNDSNADKVYGQPGFSSMTINYGGLSASSLHFPHAVALDRNNNLYVADTNNNRVLYFVNDGNTTADAVYGQGQVFNTNIANNGGIGSTSLNAPRGVAVDNAGRLFVADTGNNRVLTFDLPKLSINDVSQNEGNSGTTDFTFAVSMSEASTDTVTVNYATANNTAIAPSDYISASGVITFNPGITSQTITVKVNGDTTSEASETFNLTLSGAKEAIISDTLGIGTIQADDAMPLANGTVKLLANPVRVASTLAGDNLNSPKLTATGATPTSGVSSSTTEFTIGGKYNIPANATGIFGVLTNVGCSGGGNFRFWTGTLVPNAANLNIPGANSALNLSTNFVAALSNGKIKLGLGSGGEVTCGYVLDVSGYITAPDSNSDRVTLLANTVRVASTQANDNLNSPKLTATGQVPANTGTSTLELTIGGKNNIPATAKGIIGVLTNVGCSGGGNFRFWTGSTVPNAANLNVPGALSSLNLSTGFITALENGKVKLGLGSGGEVTCGYVVDVVGYINSPDSGGNNLTLLSNTVRVASTQANDNLNSPKLVANAQVPANSGTSTNELTVGGSFNIPANAKGVVGVLVNVGCSGGGNFRFWTGSTVPNAANLNVPGAFSALNLSTGFTAGLSASGKVKLGLGSGGEVTCGYVTDVTAYLS